MKVKKLINKCHNYENIRVLNYVGKLIWQGYVIDLKRGYPLDEDLDFILKSKVLALKPTILEPNGNIEIMLDIFIKKEHKK